MLRVTIELVPYGIEEEAQVIGRMLIANDGTGTVKHSNYAYAYNFTDRPDVPAKGLVHRFDRSQGAWVLLKKILNDKFGANDDLADRLVEMLNEYDEEE